MLWTGVVAPWYFFPMYNGMAVASMPAVDVHDNSMSLATTLVGVALSEGRRRRAGTCEGRLYGGRDGFLRAGDDAGRVELKPAPTMKSRRCGMIGGRCNHDGLPLRGMDVVVVVELVRQYGWAVPEPPLRE